MKKLQLGVIYRYQVKVEAESEGGTKPYDDRKCSLIIMNENKRASIIFKAQQSKLGHNA